jgi:hypothetical protein
MALRRRHPRTDAPEIRLPAIALAAGRVAIGVGLAVAPGRALSALGFGDHSAATVAVARIAGARDVVMGASALLALDDAERLRRATLANAAADVGDVATFGAALAGGGEEVRGAAVRGFAGALAAALAGAWLARQIRP